MATSTAVPSTSPPVTKAASFFTFTLIVFLVRPMVAGHCDPSRA